MDYAKRSAGRGFGARSDSRSGPRRFDSRGSPSSTTTGSRSAAPALWPRCRGSHPDSFAAGGQPRVGNEVGGRAGLLQDDPGREEEGEKHCEEDAEEEGQGSGVGSERRVGQKG